MATTVVTRLNGGGPNSNSVARFKITRSDGGLFTNSTGGLTTGALALSVANGDALTGFEPPVGNNPVSPYAAYPGVGAGWRPIADQVVVRGYTASKDGSGNALTPLPSAVTLDQGSFLIDTDDATLTSVKATLYMTTAAIATIILEVPV